MKRILILTSATLALSACSHGPMDINRSELDEARAAIAEAKAAGAEQCAAKEQAEAVAMLYWAAHEYSEKDVHPDENAYLAERALKMANEAKAKARTGCKPKAPEIISLSGVNFEYNSADLTAASSGILDNAVATLKKRGNIRVQVAAHTDSMGSNAYNQALSERRAASVMNYLTEHGIDAARLSSKGYGETDPIADNGTDAGRAKNRRVELRVLN